jgi:hypothetical protein
VRSGECFSFPGLSSVFFRIRPPPAILCVLLIRPSLTKHILTTRSQAAEAEAQSRGGAPAKKQRQADLSKAISEKWRSLSGEEKRVWEERAKVRFCALSRLTLKSSLRNGMGT